MVVLNKIGVLSMAKLQAILMAIMGLFLGIFYFIFGKIFASLAQAEYVETTQTFVYTMGWIGIIILPIIYGILGFVTGALGAWLYNMVAKKVGGIEIQLSK